MLQQPSISLKVSWQTPTTRPPRWSLLVSAPGTVLAWPLKSPSCTSHTNPFVKHTSSVLSFGLCPRFLSAEGSFPKCLTWLVPSPLPHLCSAAPSSMTPT